MRAPARRADAGGVLVERGTLRVALQGKQSIARIRSSPFVPRKESVRGFVYAVETGKCGK